MSNRKEKFCKSEHCQVETVWHKEHDFNEDGEFVPFWKCGNCGDQVPVRSAKPRNFENNQPSKSQQAAIDHLRRVISRDFDEAHGEDFSKFEVEGTGYDAGFWVKAEVEMLGLSESNLLRALSHEHWFVFIGPRGRIDAHSYPDSLKQFKGRQFFSINIK